MQIFITGGSGLTGPAIVAEMIAAGHAVTGLARSDESAARLQALGAATPQGSLDDLDRLRAGAEAPMGNPYGVRRQLRRSGRPGST